MPKDDLSGKKLDHISLAGADLSEWDLSHASLRRSHLEGAKLQNANLAESDLHGAHLEHADLTGAILSHTNLTEADLHGVDLQRAATTEGAKLDGAKGVPPEVVEQVEADRVLSVRWEEEARDPGVADARGLALDVQRLLAALAEPQWIVELADTHVLPPLQDACEDAATPWTLESVEADGATVNVTATWDRPEATLRRLRADAFTLIGTIAESVTFVQQHRAEGVLEYHIATGMLAEDGPFASHGHMIRLRVGGPAVGRLLGASQGPSW